MSSFWKFGALGIDTPELFSTEKAQIVPVQNVSLQKLYQNILSDFESVVARRIEGLRQQAANGY